MSVVEVVLGLGMEPGPLTTFLVLELFAKLGKYQIEGEGS